VSQLSDHENYYNFFDNRPSNSITLVEGFEKLSDEQLKGLVRRMNGHSFLSKQCLTILLVSPNIQGYFLHHAPDLSNRTITIDTTQQDLDLGQQP
jgi:hypothetical protein